MFSSMLRNNLQIRLSPLKSPVLRKYINLDCYLLFLSTMPRSATVAIINISVLDLHISVANGFVSSKIFDKRDDFDFDIVNFPFLDGDVPRRASYGVYISHIIRFARVCNHVTDFNGRAK